MQLFTILSDKDAQGLHSFSAERVALNNPPGKSKTRLNFAFLFCITYILQHIKVSVFRDGKAFGISSLLAELERGNSSLSSLRIEYNPGLMLMGIIV